MSNLFNQQVRIAPKSEIRDRNITQELSFFDALGNPVDVGFTAVEAPALIATDDATDPATTMALANENKAAINDLIAGLVDAGIFTSESIEIS